MAKEHRSPLGPVSQGPSFKNTHLLGKVASVSSMLSPCNFFRELFFSHVESCRGLAEITVKMSTLRNLKIAWNYQQWLTFINSRAENVKKVKVSGILSECTVYQDMQTSNLILDPLGHRSQRAVEASLTCCDFAPYMQWNSLQAAVSSLTCSITHGDQEM